MNTYNSNTTNGTSGNWIPTIHTSSLIPNNTLVSGSTTTVIHTGNISLIIKRCRNCNHAHLDSQPGCIDSLGLSVAFISYCNCKEYVPKDNLEYLEYLYEKKEHKESL